MSVYVDPLMTRLQNANWRWPTSCHLVADTLDELHAFAAKLGMKRSWFQNHKRLPHYDLNASRRAQAVRMGAVEITHRQLVEQFMRDPIAAVREAGEEKIAAREKARKAR